VDGGGAGVDECGGEGTGDEPEVGAREEGEY
jgi:hypothetical protein